MDPFSASPSPQAAGSTPCARCGTPKPSSELAYDDAGQLVCRTCAAGATVAALNTELKAKDMSGSGNMWAGAVASVVMGLGTLCTLALGEWFFVASPIAVFAGVSVGLRLIRDPRYRREMGAGFPIAVVLCAIGAVLGTISTLLGLAIVVMS